MDTGRWINGKEPPKNKYETSLVLKIASYLTNEFGYIARTQENSTYDQVMYYLHEGIYHDLDLSEEEQRVNDAVRWLFAQKPSNDYITKLQGVLKDNLTLTDKQISLVVSIFSGFDRSQHIKNEKDKDLFSESQSTYYGNVNEGIQTDLVRWRFISHGFTKCGNEYYLYKFFDSLNHVFIYFAPRRLENYLESAHEFKAVVKQHRLYNSVMQTVVSDVTLL